MQLSKPGLRFSYLLKHMSAYIKAGEGTELSCTKAAKCRQNSFKHRAYTFNNKKNPHTDSNQTTTSTMNRAKQSAGERGVCVYTQGTR